MTQWTIAFILLALLGLGYLAWWWLQRKQPFEKARRLARTVAHNRQPAAAVLNDLLEYARILPLEGPEIDQVCQAVAMHQLRDDRAAEILLRYFAVHPVQPKSILPALWLAQLLEARSTGGNRRAYLVNARRLLDQASQFEPLPQASLLLRARLSVQLAETSPEALEVVHQALDLTDDPEQREIFTYFLFHSYRFQWEQADSPLHSQPELLARAAPVVAEVADPKDPHYLDQRLLLAAEMAYEAKRYEVCFNKTLQLRSWFGPESLKPAAVWVRWARSAVALVNNHWEAYRLGAPIGELKSDSLNILPQLFEKACQAEPKDRDLLAGRAWTCLRVQAPMDSAKAVYEECLNQRIPLVPAVQELVEHYLRLREWPSLTNACRFLLEIDGETDPYPTQHTLVKALVESGKPVEQALFLTVYERDSTYPALNEQLARHFLNLDTFTPEVFAPAARLLDGPFPVTFTTKDQAALREKYCLQALDRGLPYPPDLNRQAAVLLEAEQPNPRLMIWYIQTSAPRPGLLRSILERLIASRPVNRDHALRLARIYAGLLADGSQAAGAGPGVSETQMARLADALQAAWQSRGTFDLEDIQAGLFLSRAAKIKLDSRRKLFMALLTLQPSGWQADAREQLPVLLDSDEAAPEVLESALNRLFSPGDYSNLHIDLLETYRARCSGADYHSLRLLGLYDMAAGLPGQEGHAARQQADALAQALSLTASQGSREVQHLFVEPLSRRILKQPDLDNLQRWELDHLYLGCTSSLNPTEPETLQKLQQAAGQMIRVDRQRAVTMLRWVYEKGQPSCEDAGVLLALAVETGQPRTGDRFWFDAAGLARQVPGYRSQAENELAAQLLAFPAWNDSDLQAARSILGGPHRAELAQKWIEFGCWGSDPAGDADLMALLDENLALAYGKPDLLNAYARVCEERHDDARALATYQMIEDSVASSEGLALKVLSAMHNQARNLNEDHIRRMAGYLDHYPNTDSILAGLTHLARSKECMLPFDLAFKIINRWGELVEKQSGAPYGVVDPNNIVIARCEIFNHYQDQMTASQQVNLLESFNRHNLARLSEDARRRIIEISKIVLNASHFDPASRKLVADILNRLGELGQAVDLYEQLADLPEYHAEAVKAMQIISRRLEDTQTQEDIPTLIIIYSKVAEDLYSQDKTAEAEEMAARAKGILTNRVLIDELNDAQQEKMDDAKKAVLKFYQGLLEARMENGEDLPLEKRRDLADTYRMLGLWDKAGKVYVDLADLLKRAGRREEALDAADEIFTCYYKAGSQWWEKTAEFMARILTNRNAVSERDTEHFSPREMFLVEKIALLYHSLAMEKNLDTATRYRSRRAADQHYHALSLKYFSDRDYLNILRADLQSEAPKITAPFDIVPWIQDQGSAGIATNMKYERLELVGSGHFADVYKVRDEKTKEVYAMKLINAAGSSDPKVKEKFDREKVLMQQIVHPNIVHCIDSGSDKGRQYIIMEYVDGSNLDKLISRATREVTILERLDVFLKVCGAVEYLHQQGILHRDLHPGNVLVGGQGLEHVKLTDFGLATLMDRDGLAKSSRVNGRTYYIPPEVADGKEETVASEIYSLGRILCFLLTGSPQMDRFLANQLKSPAYYGLDEVIEKATSNEPGNRYSRVTQLIHEVCQRAGLPPNYGSILVTLDPRRFNHLFEITQENAAEGQMGPVHKAVDHRFREGQAVALKEIASQKVRGSIEKRAEQFFRIRDLTHPNLVSLQGFYRVEQKLYVVMDWVEGRSLAGAFREYEQARRRFSPRQVLQIINDAACGLNLLHEHSIVHGCVLPTNILLQKPEDRARVSDFAASVLLDGEQWHQSARFHNFDYYLPPETNENEPLTPASDVFSLGWLLCQLATGRRGTLGEREIYAGLAETGGWTEEQIEAITNVILGSTLTQPQQREFSTAGQFLEALPHL